jgi:DNA-directed RNA polymerase specialized sigma subunit
MACEQGSPYTGTYDDEEALRRLVIANNQHFRHASQDTQAPAWLRKLAADHVPLQIDVLLEQSVILVKNAIRPFRFTEGRSYTTQDLEQEAVCALWKAVPHYVPTRGSTFKFLTMRIQSRLLKLTTRSFGRQWRLIARRDPDGPADLLGNIPDRQSEDVSDSLPRSEDVLKVLAAIDIIARRSPKMGAILKARLGIAPDGTLTGQTRTFGDIAQELGMFRQAVEKSYKQGMKQLRKRFGVELDGGVPTE